MTAKLIDGSRRVLVGLGVLLGLAGVVAWTGVTQSGIEPGETAERAVAHLERIAEEPRPLGSAANDDTEDYLVGQLRDAGLDVEVQEGLGGRADTGVAAFGRVDNVVATREGSDSTGTVVLAAHHDSAELAPGASDDGAAVAALLETVRELGETRNDVVVLITDGEEDGLLGASAFVREHRDGGVVLNFEARGTGGPSLMFETSRDNAELVDLFTSTVPDPRGDSSMVEVYRILPNDTDFSVLSAAGFTGLNFAYIEGASRYHTERDDLANLDLSSLQHHADNMSSLAAVLKDADLRALDSDHDDTYFRPLGLTVSYPNGFVWPLAVLALAGVGLLVPLRKVRVTHALAAAGTALVALLAAFGLGQAFWAALSWIRPEYVTSGGFAHRPVGYHVAVLLVGVAVLVGWYRLLRRRIGAEALVVGGVFWAAALGVLCAAFAPGASFLFTVPALGAVAGAAVAARAPLWGMLGLVPAAALLPYFGYMTFEALGLMLVGVGALFVVLFGLLVLPVVEMLDLRRWAVPVVVATGVVAAGVGLVVDGRDAEHPAHTHLAYVLDADSGRAHWVSAETEPTEWTAGYVTGQDTGDLPPGYQRGDLWTGDAPARDLDAPDVEVVERTEDTVTIRVDSRRDAPVLRVRVDAPVTEVTATVGQEQVTVGVEGTRSGTWPGEIRFHDLPPDGVELTIATRAERVTVIDETIGDLDRPADLVAGIRDDSDTVAVVRTVRL